MADDHARDELAQLRALVESQQVRLARLECPRRRLPRRVLPLGLVALLLLLTPLSLLAAAPFNDLTGGVHDANIGLIYDAGITKGCVPNVSYCPTANVTREEMASFLARTAGLGSNPPVVNAKTAQTATNATTAGHASSADTATTATNATQLNGQAASFYQPAGQPIANATTAQTLQGYAPSGLVRVARGSGAFVTLTTSYQTLATVTLTAPSAGFVLVQGTANIVGGNGDSASTRLRDTAGGAVAVSPDAITATGTGAGAAFNMPASPTWVFPVPAGDRTFVIEARGSPAGAQNCMITALFVPFGSGGAGTLGTP